MFRLERREFLELALLAVSGTIAARSAKKIREALITAFAGPLATIVAAVCPFPGGRLRRTVCFYDDLNRIDFEAETEDLPAGTVVWTEFPLADDITEVRRGIPYGFSHGAWSQPNPNLAGINKGILPVIRWSHYSLAAGGGVALLDRGVPARELVGKTASILLHNTNDH